MLIIYRGNTQTMIRTKLEKNWNRIHLGIGAIEANLQITII